MLKGQDIILLLRLAGLAEVPDLRTLASQLRYDLAGVHRSVKRLEAAGLIDQAGGRVNSTAAKEFLLHGAKYVFPAVRGSETRGLPTAWAADPLASELVAAGVPPVWPYAKGKMRGFAFEPVHNLAVEASLADSELYERLALFDAIRGGDARSRGLAARMLGERLANANAK